ADSRKLEGGAGAGDAAPRGRSARAQPQVGRRGGWPRHVRVPRRGEAGTHARAHREVQREAHYLQGHRGAGAGAAHHAARAEGTVGAGEGRETGAQGHGAGDDRDARGRRGEGPGAVSDRAERGRRDPGGGREDHGHAPRGNAGRHRPLPARLPRGGEARADAGHPPHAAGGEAPASAGAGRCVRARSRGLRVARRVAQGRARRSREGSRARRRCPRAARPDRADRAGESCGGAAAAGRAGRVRVRPGVWDPGRPAARIRAGVPARGRGAGAARPDPRLGGGAPRAARHRGGARRTAAGNRRAQRQVGGRAAGVAREGEAVARPGARPHRGKGVYVSSVAIHCGASVTRNQIYPPYIIERSSRGERTYDIFSRLLLDRIVFLGTQINDEVSNIIIAQLLFLDADNPERDIYLYVNSPGGLVSSGMAIYDTMQFLRAPVNTICMGMAASMGSFLLAAGRKGKRSALPHARIMMHQPSGGTQGTAADIEIQAREILYLRGKLNELYAKHTGKALEQIEKDMDRDRFMSAEEAKEYGLIDHVIANLQEIDNGKKK